MSADSSEVEKESSCSSGTCPISNPKVVAFFVPFFIVFFLEVMSSPQGGVVTPRIWQTFLFHCLFQATIFGLFSLFLCTYLARRKKNATRSISSDVTTSG
jgi:hypothetical protein